MRVILRTSYVAVDSDIGSDKSESGSEEEIEDTPPSSPTDVKENIKQKFLTEMPEDFYNFWEFCKSEKADSPTGQIHLI